MGNNVPVTQTTNIVPVQGIFQPEPTFALISFIGPAGTPFYAPFDPVQSGLTITNSTIDSSVIGGTVAAAGYFTSIYATTGQVATSPSADIDIVPDRRASLSLFHTRTKESNFCLESNGSIYAHNIVREGERLQL